MIRSIVRPVLVITLASVGVWLADSADAQRRVPGAISSPRPVRLVYAGACGWQGSGRAAYIVGGPRATTAVTVRASFQVGPNEWSRTSSYWLAPGSRQLVGCTRGDNSMEWTSFAITDERPL
jgi:hypothetical protein